MYKVCNQFHVFIAVFPHSAAALKYGIESSLRITAQKYEVTAREGELRRFISYFKISLLKMIYLSGGVMKQGSKTSLPHGT